VPYKLAIKKMTNGLLSKSASTMVTCAEDGPWGYRTPLYMLNHLIRLQAVVEIITNESQSPQIAGKTKH
jgi:hypothetical protein